MRFSGTLYLANSLFLKVKCLNCNSQKYKKFNNLYSSLKIKQILYLFNSTYELITIQISDQNEHYK